MPLAQRRRRMPGSSINRSKEPLAISPGDIVAVSIDCRAAPACKIAKEGRVFKDPGQRGESELPGDWIVMMGIDISGGPFQINAHPGMPAHALAGEVIAKGGDHPG